MPRPAPEGVQRFHHLKGIPSEYQKVLFSRKLHYTAHASLRFSGRVEQRLAGVNCPRPEYLDAATMRLLASDVANGKVVMQVWRVPLEGVERDLVLAVSDVGRVATVWVVTRDDPDGIKQRWPKSSRSHKAPAELPVEPVGSMPQEPEQAGQGVEARAVIRRAGRWLCAASTSLWAAGAAAVGFR